MISDEWEEEYYIRVNEEMEQVEVRFFSRVDRVVFAQSYSSSSTFSFDEAMALCDRLCHELTHNLGRRKYYIEDERNNGGNDELQGMGGKPVRAQDD